MLRIAICDPDLRNSKETADILTRTCFDVTDIQFFFYETGMQIINDVMKQDFLVDLLFIDIILPDINGLKTVEFIRKQNLKTDIIFLTEAAEFALDGYRYHAFDFLVKPVEPKRMEKVMRRYLEEKVNPCQEVVEVYIRGCGQKLQLQKIMFFESRERKIAAVTAADKVEFYMKMNELSERIVHKDFIRCHQSYIVNRNFISSVTATEVLLLDGRRIPMSKRYSRQVRDALRME